MNVWTWGGKYFGYVDGEDLWTYNGQNVGRIYNDRIFGPKGNYLGEIMKGDRLITHQERIARKGPRFTPAGKTVGRAKCVNYESYEMISGYQDFPSPEEF